MPHLQSNSSVYLYHNDIYRALPLDTQKKSCAKRDHTLLAMKIFGFCLIFYSAFSAPAKNLNGHQFYSQDHNELYQVCIDEYNLKKISGLSKLK